MRQRKRDAGLVPVDLSFEVAYRTRQVGFETWLAEVQFAAARSTEQLDASPQSKRSVSRSCCLLRRLNRTTAVARIPV